MVWRSSRARNLLNSGGTSDGQLITDYCLSSEHESSEGEFVEPEKPWPPVDSARASRSRTKVAELRMPRPHSHLFRKSDGRARGSKHSRRWENCKESLFTNYLTQRGQGNRRSFIVLIIFSPCLSLVAMFLSSLHQIPEEELEGSSIIPAHASPLTKLHNSDKCMQVSIYMYMYACRPRSPTQRTHTLTYMYWHVHTYLLEEPGDEPQSVYCNRYRYLLHC